MKKQYFLDSTYKTATRGRKRFLRSRFVFTLRFFRIVLRSRRLALKGRYDWNEWSRSSIDIMRQLEDCGAMFTVKGFDILRELKEPVVFISNHMSALETMVFPCLIAPFMDVTFVVKDSLVSYPFFGPIMRSRNPIVVSRDNSRQDLITVLNEGKEKLASGTSIIIFPQSTRRDFLKISEFNSLGVKLAEKSSAKVVPVAIKTDFWRNGKVYQGPWSPGQEATRIYRIW